MGSNRSDKGINYKKLFFESSLLGAIIIICLFVELIPSLNMYGEKETDKYAKYREIVEQVDSYDYSKGRDEQLERVLDMEGGDSVEEFYFRKLARAVYYCNTGLYRTATATFEALDQIVLDSNEEVELGRRTVLCERKATNAK
jgi:hypothetical protein